MAILKAPLFFSVGLLRSFHLGCGFSAWPIVLINSPAAITNGGRRFAATKADDFEAFVKKQKVRSALSEYESFNQMGSVEQEVFVQLMNEKQVKKGDLIVKDGDEAAEFFLVADGTLESFKDGEELFSYGAGDLIGAISYAADKPYLYNVRATSDAILWFIDNKDIDNILPGGKKQDFKQSMDDQFKSEQSAFKDYLEHLDKKEAIAANPVFGKLSQNDLDAIAHKLKHRKFQRGDLVIKEGSHQCDSMFLVKNGVFICYKEGSGKILTRCKKSNVFGELGVLLNRPRQASVRTESDTAECWELSREDLFDSVKESPLGSITKDALMMTYTSPKKLLSLEELHQYLVIKSRPKMKPVSFHSTFSNVASGVFLAALIPFFRPFKGDTLLFDLYTNVSPMHGTLLLLSCWMMTMTSFLGFFRLSPRAPRCRKAIFESALIFNLYQTVAMSSSLNGHPTLRLFDGFSLPGKAALLGSAGLLFIGSLRLIDDTIAGGMKGRETISGMDDRRKGFIVAVLLYVLAFAMLTPLAPLITSDAATYLGKAQEFTAAGINGWFLSTCFSGIAQGSFGSLLSTFQFEKKISKRQGLLWSVLLLFFLNIDPLLFTRVSFGRMKHSLPTKWFADQVVKCKLIEVFVLAGVGTIVNAFRRKAKNK